MTVVWLRGRLPERGLFTVEAGWLMANLWMQRRGWVEGGSLVGFFVVVFVKIDNISLNVLVLF